MGSRGVYGHKACVFGSGGVLKKDELNSLSCLLAVGESVSGVCSQEKEEEVAPLNNTFLTL